MRNRCPYFKVVQHEGRQEQGKASAEPPSMSYCTHPHTIHRTEKVLLHVYCNGEIKTCDIPLPKVLG